MRQHLRWIVLGVLAVAILGTGIGAYGWARQVQSSAEAGKASIQLALDALQAGDVAKAQTGFVAAQESFAATRSQLGPDWLKEVPFLGRQLQAVDKLAQVGAEGAAAGQQVTGLLAAAKDSGGGINALLKVAKPYILASLDSFDRLAVLVPQLSTDSLLPPVADAVTSAKESLAPLEPIFAKSGSISTLTRYLLSSDHRFLLVSQNNAELRPTGGFMGSYGLLKVGPNGLKLERYKDIVSLPVDTLNLPKPAGARMGGKILRIHDANWWVDFPTSAKMILKLYNHLEQPQPKVDGVIAIDLITVKALLGEFGPIKLKDYGKTITSENMIQTLVVLIEQELAHTGQSRKDVLARLSEELLARMLKMSPSELVPTARLSVELANQKRVQHFLEDDGAQQAVAALGWDGAVNAGDGFTDLLGVDNAVVWPSKMNMGVHKTIDYQVELAADGTAKTQLKLHYAKDSRRILQIQRQWFGNYLRVYRPEATMLTGWSSKRSMKAISGAQKDSEIRPRMATDALGLPAITAGFGLLPGETRTETYQTSFPNAITTTGGQLHYRLLIVKQPDLEENQVTVRVAVPQGWAISGANAWLRTSGSALGVDSASGAVTLSAPLSEDAILDVVLVRP